MELAEARTALKTAISNGLHDEFDVQDICDNPNVPGCIVYPDTPFDWRDTFDGLQVLRLCVLILVPYVDTRDAQVALDNYISRTGVNSVPHAIETNTIFSVTQCKTYEVMSMFDGGTRFLACELVVEVRV